MRALPEEAQGEPPPVVTKPMRSRDDQNSCCGALQVLIYYKAREVKGISMGRGASQSPEGFLKL